MYGKGAADYRLLVGVYVDDLVITGSDSNDIESFKLEMKGLFQMSDLGLLSYYLGIEVRQSPAGLCPKAGGEGRPSRMQAVPDADGAAPQAVQGQHGAQGGCDPIPELSRKLAVPGAHQTGSGLLGRIRVPLHGSAD